MHLNLLAMLLCDTELHSIFYMNENYFRSPNTEKLAESLDCRLKETHSKFKATDSRVRVSLVPARETILTLSSVQIQRLSDAAGFLMHD